MDADKHTRILDARVVISNTSGSDFSAFDGAVVGKTLVVMPNRMIVQSWSGSVWAERDLDSVLILTFAAVPGGAQVTLVHANCPDGFAERWDELYWERWRAYLEGSLKKRAKSAQTLVRAAFPPGIEFPQRAVDM